MIYKYLKYHIYIIYCLTLFGCFRNESQQIENLLVVCKKKSQYADAVKDDDYIQLKKWVDFDWDEMKYFGNGTSELPEYIETNLFTEEHDFILFFERGKIKRHISYSYMSTPISFISCENHKGPKAFFRKKDKVFVIKEKFESTGTIVHATFDSFMAHIRPN